MKKTAELVLSLVVIAQVALCSKPRAALNNNDKVNFPTDNNHRENDDAPTVLSRAAAPLTPEDCECQCSRLMVRLRRNGPVFGNCNVPFRNRLWCYVENPEKKSCPDAVASAHFENQYWSFHACATPEERKCKQQVESSEEDESDEDEEVDFGSKNKRNKNTGSTGFDRFTVKNVPGPKEKNGEFTP